MSHPCRGAVRQGWRSEERPAGAGQSEAQSHRQSRSHHGVACAAISATIPADLPVNGCTDRQGNVVIPGSTDCADGRTLVGDVGAWGKLWGYAGGAAHHDTPETDEAYKAAYSACQ